MTDGIIQEVFTNNRIKYHRYIIEHHCSGLLEKLQQELIEKIKQESGYFKDGNIIHLKHKIITLEKLIGDNQE